MWRCGTHCVHPATVVRADAWPADCLRGATQGGELPPEIHRGRTCSRSCVSSAMRPLDGMAKRVISRTTAGAPLLLAVGAEEAPPAAFTLCICLAPFLGAAASRAGATRDAAIDARMVLTRAAFTCSVAVLIADAVKSTWPDMARVR